VRSALRERTRPGVWRFSLLVFAAAALQSISHPAASDPAPASGAEARILDGRVVGVTDGDTLTLLVDREQIRIRLAQIDAPESNQPYGKKAKAALSTLAFGKQARVEVVDIDRYGRTVGEIFVGEIDINHEMVREPGRTRSTHTRRKSSNSKTAREPQRRASGRCPKTSASHPGSGATRPGPRSQSAGRDTQSPDRSCAERELIAAKWRTAR